MKRHSLFCLICAFGLLVSLSVTALGQITDSVCQRPSLLRISIAGLHYQAKDQLISPLRWSGVGPGLRFSYLLFNPSMAHEVDMLLPAAFLSNRYDHSGYAWEVALGYTALRRLNASMFGGTLSVGGQIQWNANCQIYADWDDSHLYWLNTYEVGPVLRWTKDYEAEQHLSASLHFPLLALVSRPPEYQYADQPPLNKLSYYLEALHKDLKLTSLNDYASLGIKTDYVFKIGTEYTFGASWLFQYKTCRLPKRISIVCNTLAVSYLIGM